MWKKEVFLLLCFLFVISFASSYSSSNYSTDIITSSGGTNESSENYSTDTIVGTISGVTTSSNYNTSLGFFYGQLVGSVCGNGVCEAGEDCSNCVADCGCSSGYSCSSGTCVADAVSPTGGGSSGGGTSVSVVTEYLSVTPEEININLAINTNKEIKISVKNIGATSRTIFVSQQNLDSMVLINNGSFILASGETKTFSVVFVALEETGIFTGKIKVGNKEIPVSLNIRTKLLLFDSNIAVLNKDYLVEQGNELQTEVTLIPMGEKERLDVTLHYIIKDYENKVYLTHSETILVTEKVNFRRNFDTGTLPPDKYIVGLELVYPNGVAPSSAHFEVVSKYLNSGKIFILIITILIILILVISILLIILFKRRKKEGENKGI